MKKSILTTLLFSLISLNAMAQMIKVDDQLVIKERIAFLSTDGQGIANLADLFRDKTYLTPGYVFNVTDVKQSCNTEKHIGKYIKRCTRRITLETEQCGADNTDGVLEQIISYNLKMYLRVESNLCTLTVSESDNNAGIMGKASVELLAERSSLNEYLLLLK